MKPVSRRRFLQLMAAGATLTNGCQTQLSSRNSAHVVIVGGGFGGATAAKTLRMLNPGMRISLIEPKSRYITCPGSNWMFAEINTLQQLTLDYEALKSRYGISVIADRVKDIRPEQRSVVLSSGEKLHYDRMILSPGIAFRWDAIAGYSPDVAEQFPHAWQAGPQTLLLVNQLRHMPAGGVVLIVAPPDPYRCPPGPYERASMMACWLKQHNPRAKILILDPKRSFSKQALFEAGWRTYFGYGGANSLIEWRSLADNPIVELDAGRKTVISDFGDRFSGDVLNIIPPQTAANIALSAGLADSSGWCPINPQTSQSPFDEYIHVIGDSAQFSPIPKSAFAANSEAKACAFAVDALLNGSSLPTPNWLNNCYSLITPQHGISVAGVYKLDHTGALSAVVGAGGVSGNFTVEMTESEANYARSGYRSLVKNVFL